jgi:ribosomal protein S18 acetylase RimI-like enzyme
VKHKKFAPLKSFSCGRQGQPWEKMINEWVRDLYLGTVMRAQTVVVLEDAIGKLVGVCSFLPHPLDIPASRRIGNSQRIHMLGTDRLFRGERLADGSSPGDVLLRGALQHIEIAGEGRMPYVSALVAPENDRSLALFKRHGFTEQPYAGEGAIICVRAPSRRRRWTAWKSGK